VTPSPYLTLTDGGRKEGSEARRGALYFVRLSRSGVGEVISDRRRKKEKKSCRRVDREEKRKKGKKDALRGRQVKRREKR